MDKNTQKELGKITRGIPEELTQDLVKTVVDRTEEDAARAALNDPKISKEGKERLSKMIASGAFRREEQVIDEAKVKALDKYHDERIQSAIRSGKLPDPKKDPFIREREWRKRNRK